MPLCHRGWWLGAPPLEAGCGGSVADRQAVATAATSFQRETLAAQQETSSRQRFSGQRPGATAQRNTGSPGGMTSNPAATLVTRAARPATQAHHATRAHEQHPGGNTEPGGNTGNQAAPQFHRRYHQGLGWHKLPPAAHQGLGRDHHSQAAPQSSAYYSAGAPPVRAPGALAARQPAWVCRLGLGCYVGKLARLRVDRCRLQV